jgi:hypothetical protein
MLKVKESMQTRTQDGLLAFNGTIWLGEGDLLSTCPIVLYLNPGPSNRVTKSSV